MNQANNEPRRPAADVRVYPYQMGSQYFHQYFVLSFWTLEEAETFLHAVIAAPEVGRVELLVNERPH